MPEQPQLLHAANIQATVGTPIEVSPSRRMIPILGGTVTGPRLSGEILDGGVDYQFIRPNGVAELQARYVIRTTTGELIYVENNALRHGSSEAMERLKLGQPVDPKEIYFRGAVRFETAAPDFQWLTKHLFVAQGSRFPQHVELDIFQLL
jgi:hypothetical protein